MPPPYWPSPTCSRKPHAVSTMTSAKHATIAAMAKMQRTVATAYSSPLREATARCTRRALSTLSAAFFLDQ